MSSRRNNLGQDELAGLLKDGLVRATTRPTVLLYNPHEKQVRFHSSPAKGRLYIGGNRSGKTVGGICEDIFRLRGSHPYQKVPPGPIRGRIVTVSYTEGIEMIIKPELAKWLPPSDLINGSWEDSWQARTRTLELSNGSTVELMSYDQKLEKFAGTSRDFIHFDEEPPKDIFTECKMRLVDTGGPWYITMTPVEGMTWVYDELFVPGLKPGSNIDVIMIEITENPYISRAEIANVLEGLNPDEKKARAEGKFVQIGGLAFKAFSPLSPPRGHVIDPVIPPSSWTHYASLDHGLNAPACWLWHAVSPKGLVVTYDEIHESDRIIPSLAREYHERNRLEGRRAPNINVGDPSIVQRNAQTGDSIQTAYAIEGVPIALGNNNVPIGVEKMNRYLKQGQWLITGNCTNLIRALQRVRWKTYESAKKRHDNDPREELHRKDSHAPDSARYFFSFMPDLRLTNAVPGPAREMSAQDIIKQTLNPATYFLRPEELDMNLMDSLQGRRQTEWTTVDEHLGGIW